ncbi:hypothetical protein [Pseudomonas putida]|uniref:Uncharacterized protein n=1 Tax=Pseudomonas putida TaxID=303 RepID=A0A8I1JJ49_PSEPU|nr:hypothetical protein [Pseudomonas putida]MBI6883239.1 hypothetical protein [Pseudomonas putida]
MKQDNPLYIIAKALANSTLRECFVVADEAFEIAPLLPGFSLDMVSARAGDKQPLHEMILGYYDLNCPLDTTFRDGSEVTVDINGLAILVSARRMDDDGSCYRFLFSKIDGVELQAHLRKQIEALTVRVEQLEESSRRQRQI